MVLVKSAWKAAGQGKAREFNGQVRNGIANNNLGIKGRLLAYAALMLVFLFSAIRFSWLRGSGRATRSLGRTTRRARWMGYSIALMFFGGFGLWSVMAPLASAAIAPGVVSPDGSRKTVQHLEGGIIRSINVHEGDEVHAGEKLVTLENVTALARYEELTERLVFLLAKEARLAAEESDHASIAFPADLVEEYGHRAELAMKSQQDLFDNRRETQNAREEILSKRILQLREEIDGLTEVIAAQEQQIKLFDEEIQTAEKLYGKKLEKRSNLLTRQRERAAVDASRASNVADIAKLHQQIGETELQILATRQQGREQVSEQLSEVRAELAGLRSQLPQRADALARTTVTAPISGRVMNVLVTTEMGGVLKPGDPILDIVPDDARLIVDAKVRPRDIDSVRSGLRARIVLTAYSQRNLPYIYGTVRSVSADRLTDERTGEAYFLARVEVDTNELEALKDEVELVAGMPADVLILTGDRTLFDSLFKPVADSFRYSFREK
jgi:HlyD family secretion protein/epimerase transport system membrane fusion protein